LLGEAGVAAGSIEDGAARDADQDCGLGDRAAEAQQVAKLMAPGFVEQRGPAGACGGCVGSVLGCVGSGHDVGLILAWKVGTGIYMYIP
jgi:hypothetical protein